MEINTLKDLYELTEKDYPNVTKVKLIGLGLTEVPEKIYNLLNLEILILSYNQIVNFDPSQPLPSLQNLYLGYNQIVNFDPIQPLPSLQKLYLSYNQIVDFDPSQPLPSLQKLSLYYNQIVNFDPTQPLPSLRELHLSGNQIVNFDPTQPLPSLQELYLSSNHSTKSISIIYKYKDLKHITPGLNYVKLTKIKNYNHFRYLNNFLDYNKSFQSLILCLLIQSNLSYELIYLILDLLLQKLYNFSLDIYSK